MSWINKTDNGRWIARYRKPDGRTRSKTWDLKTDAKKWLRAELRNIDTGTWIDAHAGHLLFADLAETHRKSRVDLRPSTRVRDDSYMRSLILPHFGSTPVAKISTEYIQSWVAQLVHGGYAPETVRKAHQILSAALETAVNQNRIATNPCRGVKLPRPERREMRFLTLIEVRALAEGIDPRWRAMVFTGALCGLRFGEVASLQVASLDLEGKSLTVTTTLSDVSGEPLRLAPPKTKASRRRISLPQFMIDEFEMHLAGHSGSGFVFQAPRGGPIRRTTWQRRVWLPAVGATVGEPLRFHDLRHTHVALLIDQGEHPKAIQTRLGHASITTTMDRYGHLFEGTDQAVAARLDAVLTGTPAHSTRTPDTSGRVAAFPHSAEPPMS